MISYIAVLLICFLICYCFGSVLFGVIVSKIAARIDVRKYGSGNAGATNVMRTVGVKAAVLTFLLDAVKCAAAVLICKYCIVPAFVTPDVPKWLSAEYMQYLFGFFAMIGHSFPIFFKFKGGKAVSSALGVLACINWQIALFVLLMFAVCVVLTRMVSLGSIVGAVEFIVLTFVYSNGTAPLDRLYVTLLSVLIGGLVIYRHIPNIKRLLAGEESPVKPKNNSDRTEK